MEKVFKKYSFIFLIAFLIISDQFVKYLIRYNDGFYVCNPGISFGFIIPATVFYSLVAIIFLVAILYLWGKINFEDFLINKTGIVFILGGAISNLIDRFNYGCVTDIIDLGFWPVFNLADIFITVGAVIIIAKSSNAKSGKSLPA